MTWNEGALSRAVRRGVFAFTTLLWFGACSCSSSSKTAKIVLVTPEDGANLTLADDTDTGQDGLQVTVSGTTSGLKTGTMLAVFVDDDDTGSEGMVEDGAFSISGVTLPPGTHMLRVGTPTGSVSSDPDHSYTFRGLVISSPKDGASLQASNDEDLDQAGIQISVTVDSFDIDLSEAIRLSVDGTEVGSETPDANGQAVFEGITLISGMHRLRASSGSGDEVIESDEVVVTVMEGCAAVTFTQPAVPDGATSIVLGGGDSCPSGDAPFTTTVAISTDAGNGRPVQLFVNNQPVASATVSGAAVVFEDVPLTKLNNANTIAVEVQNSAGVTCREDLNVDVLVDCAGPDCVLASPIPVSYTDDGGDTTLYLNSSHRGADGFEFQVDTSAEAVGQTISLIVDGDERDAFTTEAEAAGSDGEAIFSGVALSDGRHTFEARCVDAAGNESFSGEVTWVVDTAACLVDVTDPVADAVLVPADDSNTTTDGTQIVLSSSVGGGDCVAQRAAVCDPANGIGGTDFVPYDGTTPLLSSVELDAASTGQTLCVEVQDEAGNIGLASVDVTFISAPPMLQVESPADGSEYNILGNGGANRVMDADGAVAGCQADFSIACTELGAQVELRHDSAAGAVFAMAECKAPGSGDPAVPTGYAGRATLRTSFDDGDAVAVVVATQTVAGSSGQLLVGASSAITLEGDCIAPTPQFFNDPCNTAGNSFLQVPSAGADYVATVTLLGAGLDIVTRSLELDHSVDGQTGPLTPDSISPTTFNDVTFGGVGDVTLTYTAVDAYDNTGIVSCSATIVEDVPSITLVAPANQTQYGPRTVVGDFGTCDTGDATEYGVPVTATVDRRSGRTVSISVEGSSTTIDLSGGDSTVDLSSCNADPDMPCTFTKCVGLQDDQLTAGGSDIVVRADSDATSAFDTDAATVHVTTVAFIGPTNGQVFASGATDCDTNNGGFDTQVELQVDPIHDGGNWSVSDGTTMVSGTISSQTSVGGCLALGQGPAILAAIVGADNLMLSVDVTVATQAPTSEVSIASACPNPASASYRDEPVHVDWSDLSALEDWPGQFEDYVFKCSGTSVTDATTPEAWWNDAYEVPLPVTPASGTTEADLNLRVGERRHCALRASDAGGALTPITESQELTCSFREALLYDASVMYGGFGISIAAVGDVNGDDIDDVLVGGVGRAYLFFGSSGGIPSAPDVTFLGPASSDVGNKVVGLGDFNGDGANDFAISYPSWNGGIGQVFVFLGRTAANPWPATANLDTTCGADLCIKHTTSGTSFGNVIRPAGDFDGNGLYDLFVGAPAASADLGQVFVVLGDSYEVRACSGNGQCRSNEICGTGSVCELDGDPFWGLDFEVPSGDWVNPPGGSPVTALEAFRLDGTNTIAPRFGANATALGEFDGATGSNAGDDLVIVARGTGSPGVSELYFLSGRSYTMGVGVQTIAVPGGLGFRAGGGTPSGTPFETDNANFGAVLVSPGNVYDAPSFNTGVVDLLVKDADVSATAFLYPGEANFARSQRVRINAPGAPSIQIGVSTASGFHPGLPPHASFPSASQNLLGDLDGDGLPELCLGTDTAERPVGSGTYSAPGAVYLWYADTFARSIDLSSSGPSRVGDVDHLTASRIEPSTSSDARTRTVQYVGDLNDDGHPDLVVSDWFADTYEGRASVLY